MEHRQAMRLEELEKRQQDLKEKMLQMTKMTTNLMKERGIVEGPNFQEESIQEKSDNQKVGHPGPIAISNLDCLSGQGKFIKSPTKQSK